MGYTGHLVGACSSIVEVLCYKPEGCEFDSLMSLLDFSIDIILPATL
jgi:hypothetical protein